ncbi:MAG: cobyrinate a,c-diamide synthase [Lachnospiraceae bacterium]
MNNRIMIAATRSGSGKTTITCGLLQAFKKMGHNVVAFKCGPDYIDPMFHQKVIGIPSKNLDTFFTGEEETRRLFLQDRSEDEFAVLEGVMGLYDGLGGVREEGSSYHLAQITKTPILLVIDAKGMGKSILPLIAGFLSYDKEKLIKGIVLNRMSGSYFKTIQPLIEKEFSIPVVGYFPESEEFHIKSRHLGLCLPDEMNQTTRQLHIMADQLQKTVSLEKILEIAKTAQPIMQKSMQTKENGFHTECPVIAVARDEAFCFYYEDNLRLLKNEGAKLQFFSPLHDSFLPEGCHGLLLGGGYPELYASLLSKNQTMLDSVRNAVENGIPTVAECGGFMYLHSAMQLKDGSLYPMVGVLPAKCFDTGRSVRFGYIELEEKSKNFLPDKSKIRGHEFHYFDTEYNGEDCIAGKPVTGKQYPCVIDRENMWVGFPHLYYPSQPVFAKQFVAKAKEYQKKTYKSHTDRQ